MAFTDKEKQILAWLVEEELKLIKNEEASIIEQRPVFIATEERYEDALKSLIEKLK